MRKCAFIRRTRASEPRDALLSAMVGERAEIAGERRALRNAPASHRGTPAVMRAVGISTGNVKEVTLAIERGEIVGIARLGSSALGRVLAGGVVPSHGTIEMNGTLVKGAWSSRKAIAMRVGFVPVGSENSDRTGHAARYSLISPPNTSRRWMRSIEARLRGDRRLGLPGCM